MAFDKKAWQKEYDSNRTKYEPDRNVTKKICVGNEYHKCGRELNTFKENGDVDWFNANSLNKDGLRNECKYCYFVYHINFKYGLTLEQFENMRIEHNNKCAYGAETVDACEAEMSINEYGIPTGLDIDHWHEADRTGLMKGQKCRAEDVRGLLCRSHNMILAFIEDKKKKEIYGKYLFKFGKKKEKAEREKLKEHNRKNNNIVPFKEGEDEQ